MVRGLFKLFLTLFGLALMLGMLVFLMFYIAWASLRWLITGRPPQVAVVWQRYRDMRRGGAWRPAEHPTDMSDVVDVEAREVKPETPPIQLLK